MTIATGPFSTEGGQVTLAGFWRHLNLPGDPPAEHDARVEEISVHLDAAMEIVQNRCGPLTSREVVRKVPGGGGYLLLPTRALAGVTSIVDPNGTTVPLDDVDIDLEAGIVTVPARSGTWTVTTTVGYPDGQQPVSLVLAVYIIAGHLYGTQRPRQSQTQRMPVGMSNDSDPAPLTGFAIPNRALELMRPYENQVALP